MLQSLSCVPTPLFPKVPSIRLTPLLLKLPLFPKTIRFSQAFLFPKALLILKSLPIRKAPFVLKIPCCPESLPFVQEALLVWKAHFVREQKRDRIAKAAFCSGKTIPPGKRPGVSRLLGPS